MIIPKMYIVYYQVGTNMKWLLFFPDQIIVESAHTYVKETNSLRHRKGKWDELAMVVILENGTSYRLRGLTYILYALTYG